MCLNVYGGLILRDSREKAKNQDGRNLDLLLCENMNRNLDLDKIIKDGESGFGCTCS